MTRSFIALLGIGGGWALAQGTVQTGAVEYPDPLIREEQQIRVDGVDETWRLEWAAPPEPHCSPGELITCPCGGFAYGERGDLYLIRLRNSVEFDRLHLTGFFREEAGAVVQRWPYDYLRDFDDRTTEGFASRVRSRGIVRVMLFADYDHDGWETEFYLQTGTEHCGRNVGIVVGVSRSNPRLHALGPAGPSGAHLYLPRQAWRTLRDASGPVEVLYRTCGDHAAETETRFHLHWDANGIVGTRREYTCPRTLRRLLREEPLR